MSTAGPNAAGTGSGWTNSANITASDSVYATNNVAGTGVSATLAASNFGFSIPAGATINGIQASVIVKASAASSLDLAQTSAAANGIQLTKVAGTGVGTAKNDSTAWGTTNTTINLGTTSDLWGTTWAPADINSTGFGLILQCENNNASIRTASCDFVSITVTYTPAAATSTSQMFMVL